uniref:Large ribosomal subunit protein bL32c n=1 Tax=Euphorbia schimperi TaxID=212977 RepID=A0A8B0MEK1_9ROSI|nr:chloroplast ribosomal protein L32 [Euphorbia schimperi]
MPPHSILSASLSSLPLLYPITNSSPLCSSFHGVSIKFPSQSLTFSLKRPLAVVPATKKAVAVVNVEGAITLTQDDDGGHELSLTNGNVGESLACGVREATIVDSQIFLSDEESDDDFGPVSAVPKKRTSRMKKRIRKNVWKRKGAVAAKKAYSLAKSIYTGKSTSFMTDILKKDP